MATKTVVTNIDDLDGTESTEKTKVTPRRFEFDGKAYEIDLTDKNHAAMGKLLTPYTEKARRAGTPARTAGRRGPVNHLPAPRTKASRERGARIRAWAKTQGIDVGERGRIPYEIEQKYNAANPF